MVERLNQPSLVGGELAPSLWARVDLAKYRTGLKILKNWLIHPHGGVSNRPGMEFRAEVKNSANKVRIFPFVASTDDSYILEFGPGYMRVFRNGSPVVLPGTSTPFELALPYSQSQLKDIRLEQSNDVLTVTHPDHAPREISRLDHHVWTVANISFIPGIAPPTIASVAVQTNFGTVGGGEPTSSYVATQYTYAVTAVSDAGEESLLSTPVTVTNDLKWYPSNSNTILMAASPPNIIRYNFYREDNGIFGLIGTTNVSSGFVDKNFKPNLADTPPQGRNPFASSGDYPRVSAFYQQRRMFASSRRRPQTFWGSNSANYYNMSVSIPSKESDAIEATIAAKSIQEIRHMVALEDLLLLTKSGEWKVTGTKDDAISPVSIAVKPQSAYGASELVPIMIGDQILFVQAKGNAVRDIGYKFEVNRYTGNDLSILAKHLFKNRAIVAWAYSQTPDSIIWCVMSDGRLISLTYMREHEVWGWARHETRGFVEDVACVPEGDYDAAYFVVRRFINGQWRRCIERLKNRQFRTRKDAFFVDSGLSYDNPRPVTAVGIGTATSVTVIGHGFSAGDEVEIETVDAGPNGGAALNGVFKVTAPSANSFMLLTLSNQSVNTEGQDFGLATIVVRRRVKIISGLNHLEGEKVVGLADGAVIGMDGDITVVSGSITLKKAAARVHLGLHYVSDLQSLEMAVGDANVAGRIKSVVRVGLRVEDTQGLSAGPAFDKLQPFIPRSSEPMGQPPALYTGDISVTPQAGWSKGGEICVRQTYPLPATVLALIPEVEYGR